MALVRPTLFIIRTFEVAFSDQSHRSLIGQAPIIFICFCGAATQSLPQTPLQDPGQNAESRQKRRLDAPGLLTFAITMTCFLLVIDFAGQGIHIKSPRILTPLIIFILAITSLFVIEARISSHPIFAPVLFRQKAIVLQYLLQIFLLTAQFSVSDATPVRLAACPSTVAFCRTSVQIHLGHVILLTIVGTLHRPNLLHPDRECLHNHGFPSPPSRTPRQRHRRLYSWSIHQTHETVSSATVPNMYHFAHHVHNDVATLVSFALTGWWWWRRR